MFTSAILKLTSVCNLNCTYCYMFNLNDRTFTRVPVNMEVDTAIQSLDRIDAYMRTHGVKEFTVVLHGGEPTLWPIDSFSRWLSHLASLRARGANISATIQTNAVHVNWPLMDLLRDSDIGLGISLDGPKAYNDTFRVNHAGRGSYDQILRNIDAMIERGYGEMIGGFLSVANPDMPPADYLAWAKSLPVKRLSVLWPIEFNRDNPPWQPGHEQSYMEHPRYGEWFAELFELWWREPDLELQIRHFTETLGVLAGGRGHGDSLVNDQLGMFVVNTDGAIEYPDYFRSYRDGGSRTKFHVSANALDDLSDDPTFAYCLELGEHLPPECMECPHRDVCGGGFLPGRMSRDAQPPYQKSILCADQYYYFSSVEQLAAPWIRLTQEAAPEHIAAP